LQPTVLGLVYSYNYDIIEGNAACQQNQKRSGHRVGCGSASGYANEARAGDNNKSYFSTRACSAAYKETAPDKKEISRQKSRRFQSSVEALKTSA
jgi:hypothetical protein